MTAVADPHDIPLEANLGIATDAEWLAGHERLVDLVAGMDDFPDSELTFIWDPDLPASSLIDRDEVDHAPAYAEQVCDYIPTDADRGINGTP